MFIEPPLAPFTFAVHFHVSAVFCTELGVEPASDMETYSGLEMLPAKFTVVALTLPKEPGVFVRVAEILALTLHGGVTVNRAWIVTDEFAT